MAFELTILGCSSATPTLNRNPSAQVLSTPGHFFLIDCGEGTQMQLLRYKIKFHKIEHIFISHLHGDHFFGLIGLISSLHLLGRTKPLHIYCPGALEEIMAVQFKHSETQLRYELIFHPVRFDQTSVIFEDETLTVETILLSHRIPCSGFLFREKPKPRSIIKEMLGKYKIPVEAIAAIKEGKDFITDNGETVPNASITTDPLPSVSYAYCSDTIYLEEITSQIAGVDLLYHESTFMEDMKERAKATFHTTAKEAGMIAQKAQVKKLMIGHFSTRYPDLNLLLNEAKTMFANSILATEGSTYTI